MKEMREVYRGIADILATMQEALDHIVKQLDELRFEESFGLLINFTEGVQSVEAAVGTAFSNKQPANGDELKQSLSAVLAAYEDSKAGEIKPIVQNQLLPAFAKWRLALDKSISQ